MIDWNSYFRTRTLYLLLLTLKWSVHSLCRLKMKASKVILSPPKLFRMYNRKMEWNEWINSELYTWLENSLQKVLPLEILFNFNRFDHLYIWSQYNQAGRVYTLHSYSILTFKSLHSKKPNCPTKTWWQWWSRYLILISRLTQGKLTLLKWSHSTAQVAVFVLRRRLLRNYIIKLSEWKDWFIDVSCKIETNTWTKLVCVLFWIGIKSLSSSLDIIENTR